MNEEAKQKREEKRAKARERHYYRQSTGNAFYGLGMIGAAIYYVQHAAGFWAVVLALLKAIVWPAFFVYDLLQFMHG